jgi:hypothetical protein
MCGDPEGQPPISARRAVTALVDGGHDTCQHRVVEADEAGQALDFDQPHQQGEVPVHPAAGREDELPRRSPLGLQPLDERQDEVPEPRKPQRRDGRVEGHPLRQAGVDIQKRAAACRRGLARRGSRRSSGVRRPPARPGARSARFRSRRRTRPRPDPPRARTSAPRSSAHPSPRGTRASSPGLAAGWPSARAPGRAPSAPRKATPTARGPHRPAPAKLRML